VGAISHPGPQVRLGVVLGAVTILLAALLSSPLANVRPAFDQRPYLLGHSQAIYPGSAASLGSNPPFLQRVALTDDPEDGFVLEFGGETPGLVPTGLTLTYHNGTWRNLTASLPTSPSPRWGAGMGYDPIDHEVVMFGGCATSSCSPALSDTWTFSGGDWHDITATAGTPPSARGLAMMTWDGADGFVLLFGGQVRSGNSLHVFGDTWSFLHGNWTNLTSLLTGPPPAPRAGGGFASIGAGPVILFGGSQNATLYSDTWSFQAHAWTNVTGSSYTPPRARALMMMSADPTDGYLVLYGGVAGGSYLSDTWTYQAGAWSATSFRGPGPIFGAGMTFDSEDGYVLMYGGAISQFGQAGTTNGYWSFSAGSWHLFNPASPAPIDWFLPILLGVMLSIVAGELLVVRRRQKRRYAELSSLMPESRAPPTWIPTQPASAIRWSSRRSMIVLYAILVPLSMVLFFAILGFATPGTGMNALVSGLSLVVFVLVLPAATVPMIASQLTLAVGVAERGVTVRRRGFDLRIPWEYLQPPVAYPRGRWVYFQFTTPGRQSLPSAVPVTHEQARAILTHPRTQGWSVPPSIRSTLGLTAPIPSDAGERLSPSVPSAAAPPGFREDSSVGQPTAAAWPFSPPARVAPPIATGDAFTASQPTAAAQVRRCPRCSALTSLRARFCPSCGQRIF